MKKTRPDWCKHEDCEFIGTEMYGGFCGGRLPETVQLGLVPDTHRLCLSHLPKDAVGRYRVTEFILNRHDSEGMRYLLEDMFGPPRVPRT